MNKILLNRYNHLVSWPKRKALTFIILFLVMAAGALTGLATSKVDAASHHEDSNTSLVVSRLNALQSQLTSLQGSISKPISGIDLTAIGKQLSALSKRIEQLKSVDSESLNQTLAKTLTHTESALGNQLESIKNAVNHLDAKQKQINYLSPEQLPFKVVSVDSIQQVPVASILYDFKTIPLEKGDALAGWKILQIDYGKQRIELENQNKDHVLLTHEHIG